MKSQKKKKRRPTETAYKISRAAIRPVTAFKLDPLFVLRRVLVITWLRSKREAVKAKKIEV